MTDNRSQYDSEFFRTLAPGSRRSALVVLPIVQVLLGPGSVLDVGCGSGEWLAVWRALGVANISGVDGGSLDDDLKLPRDSVHSVDLTEPFDLQQKFDLVMSLEVAEHLPATASSTLIGSLVRHSDVVLFSAAIPGQGGTGHVNEKWPPYWKQKFAAEDFQPFDVLRPQIWEDSSVDFWYRQNLLLYARTDTAAASRLASLPSFGCQPIVHPELFEGYANHVVGLKEAFRHLRPALWRSLRSRFAPRTFR